MHTSLFKRMFQCDSGDLTLAEKARVALEILRGVSYLHSKRVVHNDIKLENVLVDETLTAVKLCDFGLSRVKNSDGQTKIHGQVAGTDMYKAPEMFRSKFNTVGHFATDVWAVAGVITELFTKAVLWSSKKRTANAEIMAEMKKQNLPTAYKELKRNHRNVYNVLRSAFSYDCAERPAAAVLLRNFEEIVFKVSLRFQWNSDI